MAEDREAWMESTRRLAVTAFALSGAAALIYEVVWTRELSLIFGSTIYAVSLMLMTFMTGLSLGGWVGGRWADRTGSLLLLFGKLELGIALSALASVPLIRVLPELYFRIFESLTPSFGVLFGMQLVFGFGFMIVPTFFMGATFPVVAKIASRSRATQGGDIGGVYSINTMGSVIGAAAAGFFLIPAVGVRATTVIGAALNAIVTLLMIDRSRSASAKRWLSVAVPVAIVMFAAGIAFPSSVLTGFHRHFASSIAEADAWENASKVVFTREDAAGDVTVVKTGSEFQLVDGGLIEGSSAIADQSTTRLLGVLPAECASSTKTALAIGLGTGYTSRALLSYPFKKVDTVEINSSIVVASRYFVQRDLQKDPRSKVHVTDGRNFLRASPQRFDVITSEPSWPLSKNVSHLFTKEFFELSRSRLVPDGVFCQWLPQYLLSPADYQMMYRTFHSTYPNMYVWVNDPEAVGGGDFIFIGVNGDRKLDQDAITERARERGLASANIYPYLPNELEAQALSDPGIPFNTDDRPLLEFSVPRNMVKYMDALRGNSQAIVAY